MCKPSGDVMWLAHGNRAAKTNHAAAFQMTSIHPAQTIASQ